MRRTGGGKRAFDGEVRRVVRPHLAIVLAAVVALSVGCGGGDTVTIATGGNYHPFDFVNDDGEIDGLERELGDELCRRAELECEWILSGWDTMIPDLVAGEFDAIMAGMSITTKRRGAIDFTAAYYPPTPSVYVTRAGRGDEVLRGTLGVTANTIYSDHLSELGEPFVALDGSVDAVGAVLDGDVDVVLVYHGYAVQKLAEHDGRLAIVGPSLLLDEGLGIGIRKGSNLRGRLDEALASTKRDGTLNAIIAKWLGKDAATFDG